MEEKIASCPFCKNIVPENAYFCPQCGKPLKSKPVSTAIGKQILVYSISFFLPPFGLGYAWQYVRQEGRKSKIIGVIAILLTVFSLVISFWFLDVTLKTLQDQMNQLNNLSF